MEIRPLSLDDAEIISAAFATQGWNKPVEQYHKYYARQESGDFKVMVATVNGQFAGYLILAAKSDYGPFASLNCPEIRDFNVLERFQKQGIGTGLMDCAEEDAAKISKVVTLGVGLHSGYGPAQKLYFKRGYCPDGSGLWYRNSQLEPYSCCKNDDDLVLYLYKQLY